MLYNNIDEILELFPSVSGDAEGELHTPCPYCKEGAVKTKNGITFRGDDRLVWFTDRRGVACRKCGTYCSIAALLADLQPGSVISESFVKEATDRVETHKKPLSECLTAERYVNTLHRNVDRKYWQKFKWSDTTIERFKLGYGGLYEYGSYRTPRHIIPFIPRSVEAVLDGYMLEGRLNSRAEETEYERYNIKTQGSVKGHFWHIKDAEDEQLVITEGPKDAITAWQLGYKNVMAIFGTSLWRPEFAQWIADEGYKKVIIFGDNDDAGRGFIDEVTKDLHAKGVAPFRIAWPDGLPKGFDLTDALVQEGDGIATFLVRCITHSSATRGWIENVRTFIPDYNPPTPDKALPLQTVRSEMSVILRDYIDNYKQRVKSAGRGVVKVLAAPPGSGKSYSLVQLAQEEAKKLQERKAQVKEKIDETRAEYQAGMENGDDLERLSYSDRLKKLDEKWNNYNMAKVLFASPFINAWEDITSQPGFDPELWFNFESRNEDTCQNHFVAKVIGEKGYSVMKFCETQCPFAEECSSRIRGYLRQKTLMRNRPITFVRHANLISREFVSQYEVIIIDENFLNIFADFVTIETLIPSNRSWRDYLTTEEEEDADKIEQLAAAVGKLSLLRENLSGKDCLDKLQHFLGEPLAPFIRSISDEVVKRFQPTSVPRDVEVKDLPKCTFPAFYRAILEELDEFEAGEYFNSRIHLTAAGLKVSTLWPLELPRTKKILVADGTAIPELYGLMFDRDVELYEPDIYNPEARIVQLTGTDMSRSSVKSQIGQVAYRNLGKEQDSEIEVTDLFGEKVDTTSINYTESLFESKLLSGLMSLLRSTAANPEHKSVLFVTYKNLRTAIEERVNKLAETDPDYKLVKRKTAFGHYGGLRGTNRYKDFDTVLLAGCPRQPYDDLWRTIQAWARLKGYRKYIPNQLAFKPAAYHGVNVLNGYSYITFEDEFAQQFVDMVEAGEVRQCLDRIRIYSGGQKTAYVMMSRPAVKWVTGVTSSKYMMAKSQSTKYDQVRAFVSEVWDEFKSFPTYGSVMHRFSLSQHYAKRYVEDAKKDLNLVSV